jgi:hypothetical protein
MARVLILTDRGPGDADWKGDLVWRIILSLAESQHEVLVACTQKFDEHPMTHSRLNIIRPVHSWRADQLPKLVRVLMSFQPQVVHTFALQDHGLWPALSLWPYFSGMCAVYPGLKRFSTLFDAHDYEGPASAGWHRQATKLTVFSEGHATELATRFDRPIEIVPLDFEHEPPDGENSGGEGALIPAPVSEWNSPRQNLLHVRELLHRHPELTLKIIGGWGDWPASERREGWKILGSVAGRVHLTEPVDYHALTDELREAGQLWLEPLRRNSWKFLLCMRLASQLGKEFLVASPLGFEWLPGSTANSLSRLYAT